MKTIFIQSVISAVDIIRISFNNAYCNIYNFFQNKFYAIKKLFAIEEQSEIPKCPTQTINIHEILESRIYPVVCLFSYLFSYPYYIIYDFYKNKNFISILKYTNSFIDSSTYSKEIFNSAVASFQAKQYKEAEQLLNQCIEAKTNNEFNNTHKAMCYNALGLIKFNGKLEIDLDNIPSSFDKVVSTQFPSKVNVDYKKATEAFLNAHMMDSTNINYITSLAMSYYKDHNYQKATPFLKTCSEHKHENTLKAVCYSMLGIILLEGELNTINIDEVERYFHKAYEIDSNQAQFLLDTANSYYIEKNYKQSFPLLQFCTNKNNGHMFSNEKKAICHNGMGLIYLNGELGELDYKRAEKHFLKAHEFNPEKIQYTLMLSGTNYRIKNYQKTAEFSKNCLDNQNSDYLSLQVKEQCKAILDISTTELALDQDHSNFVLLGLES